AAVNRVRELTPADVYARLNAIRAWAAALPAASGKSATVGFCWGGGTSFRYALQSGLNAAGLYYGTPPRASGARGVAAQFAGGVAVWLERSGRVLRHPPRRVGARRGAGARAGVLRRRRRPGHIHSGFAPTRGAGGRGE